MARVGEEEDARGQLGGEWFVVEYIVEPTVIWKLQQAVEIPSF
jgi:hypothetical protein